MVDARDEQTAGRHATNLELFLDLVFVFAIGQLSNLISSDISAAGVGRSVVAAWLVWQLWSQFSWLGTAIDVDRDAGTRLAFVSSIVPTLFMAIALPGAFGDDGRVFGLAVLAGTMWVLGLQGWGLWPHPTARASYVQYASVAAISPVLVAVGGFVGSGWREGLWITGSLLGIAGALGANRQRSDAAETAWTVDPVHFAERHALFVIIVLGEVLVAIGNAATGGDLTPSVVAAILASVVLAAVLWWSYFGFVSRFGEEALRAGDGAQRAALARDFFTFGHFPLVVGIAFLAAVIEHVVAHPVEHLEVDQRWLLAIAVLFVAGGFVGLQFRLRRRVAIERPIAVVVVAVVLATAGGDLAGWLALAIVAVVLAVMATITTIRVSRSFVPAGD